jgi:hypothetical protein
MSVIRGNLKETFYAVDVGMNCQWAEENSWTKFAYKTYEDLAIMST